MLRFSQWGWPEWIRLESMSEGQLGSCSLETKKERQGWDSLDIRRGGDSGYIGQRVSKMQQPGGHGEGWCDRKMQGISWDGSGWSAVLTSTGSGQKRRHNFVEPTFLHLQESVSVSASLKMTVQQFVLSCWDIVLFFLPSGSEADFSSSSSTGSLKTREVLSSNSVGKKAPSRRYEV